MLTNVLMLPSTYLNINALHDNVPTLSRDKKIEGKHPWTNPHLPLILFLGPIF